MNYSFNGDIATEYGVNAAIIFQDMGYWCEHSQINDVNYHDGLYWTFNTNNALCAKYPFMSSKAIRTAIQKLIDGGLIVTGNYNKMPFDRTLWYALTESGTTLFQNRRIDFPKRANENFPKGQMRISQKGKPIPYTTNTLDTNDDDDDDRAREEQDVNPYGESDSRPVKGTVQRYATENLKYMSPRAMEELNDFVDDLGEDLVRHGINNALDAGANTWSYVKAILNRYVDEGIKTVGEAKAYDEKFRQSRREKGNRGNTGGRSDKPNPYRQLLDTKTNSSLPPLNKSDEIL